MNARSLLRSLAAVAATGVLAGCATQDPVALLPLGSAGDFYGSPRSGYYGFGAYSRYGSYPYTPYGYAYGYGPYDYYPYDYRSRYYGARPYPPPLHGLYPRGPYCQNANRDSRCQIRAHSRPERPPPPPKVAPRPAMPAQPSPPPAGPAKRHEPPANRRQPPTHID